MQFWIRSILFASCVAVPAAAQNPAPVVTTPLRVTASSPSPAQQTDQRGFEPVQLTGRVPANARSAAVYIVPPRKRLVIEYVEGDVGWQTTVGGVTVNYFPAGVTSTEGRLVRIYADAGTRVYAVRRASSRIGLQPQGNFSGYLVDP